MKSRLKKIITFLVFVLRIVIFANEEKQTPNEIIKENPKREVTTVESMKVRDHAIMSLTVTKSKPEEIMGSLSEDGKLSVFIYKKQPKKMARSASTKDIDVSNFKLRAYTNTKNDKPMMLRANTNSDKNMTQNLSAEDIRSMMNSGAASKEKKINIVEETDEYVRLEVEDVQENEKVYISVMNGESVVKSYRIGNIQIKASDGSCWNDPSIKNYMGANNEVKEFSSKTVIPFIGGWIDWDPRWGFGNGENSNGLPIIGSGVKTVEITTNPKGKTLTLEDEYITEERLTITSLKNNSGTKLMINTNIGNKQWTYQVPRQHFLGNNGMYIWENDKSVLYNANSNTIDYATLNLNNYVKFGDKTTAYKWTLYDYISGGNCNKVDAINAQGINGFIRAFGFDFGIDIASKNNLVPGIYKLDKGIAATFKGKNNNVTKVGTYYIGIGEGANTVSKIVNLARNIGAYQEVSTDTATRMSFIKQGNFDDRGIWYIINGKETKLLITKEADGTWYGKFNVVSVDNKKEIEVKLTQKKGEFIKQEVKLIRDSDITAELNLNYGLAQKYTKIEEGSQNLRRVNYTIKFPAVTQLKNISIEIDPRVKNIITGEGINNSSWLTLKEGFGKGDVSTKEISSEIINVDQVYTDGNTTIADIDSVIGYTKAKNVTNDYRRIEKTGDSRFSLMLKMNTILAEFQNNNNFLISPASEAEYNITYKDKDDKKYVSTISVNYAEPDTQDSTGFDPVKGFNGSGTVSLTGKNVGSFYEVVHINKNDNQVQDNEIKLKVHNGFLPTFKGLVSDQKNNEIVTQYKVKLNDVPIGNENYIQIGNSIKINDNLELKLSKTGNINNRESISIKKLQDVKFTTAPKITIIYYYKDMQLGEYTLTVENEVVEKDLGTAEVKLDARIAQVDGTYSWIRLSDKRLSDLAGTGAIGTYSEFIGDATSFPHASSLSQYDAFNITDVETINDKTPDDFRTSDNGINYKYNNGINEAAIPYSKDTNKITLGQFKETGANSKLFISKWDFFNGSHDGNNKFKVVADNGVRFVGNIVEKYITQDNPNGISNMVGKIDKDTIYKGAGTLNLARAVVGQAYIFTAGTTNNITVPSPGYTNRGVTLEITSGKSLDATGVLTDNDNESIANRMIIKEGQTTLETNGSVGSELSQSLAKLGVKIGINQKGELVVTKEKDVNIESKTLTIDYYHIKNSAPDNQNIHLGTFILTLENPIVGDYNTNKVTVEIDKRFTLIDTYNWLCRSGKVIDKIDHQNSITKENYFEDFFKYGTEKLNESSNGEILVPLKVEDRKENEDSVIKGKYYHIFNIEGEKWRGEASIPISGNINNINELMLVSKGNILNEQDKRSLNNKFSLVFDENNTEKIYRGNIEEKIVGEDAKIGSGTLNAFSMTQNTEYKFKTIVESGSIQSSDPNIVITNANNPVNTKGIIDGTTNKNVANKIRVTFGNKETYSLTENNLSVESDGLKVAINTTDTDINSLGGLVLTKTAGNIADINVKVEYFYAVDPSSNNIVITGNSANAIKLGEFTLTIITKEEIVDLGEVTFSIDKRFENSGPSWLIKKGGKILAKRDARDSNELDYTGLVSKDNEFNFNGEQGNISEITVKDRVPHFYYDGSNYKLFRISENETRDEIAIYNKNILDFNENMVVSKWNRETSANYDNIFTLKLDNGKRFKGNIKEVYYGDKTPYLGNGNINLANALVDKIYVFPVRGTLGISNEVTNKFPESQSIEITDSEGILFDGRTEIPGNAVIVNKIKVFENSQAKGTYVGNNYIKVNLDNYLEIGMSDSGGLTLKKLSQINIPENSPKVIKIEYYYDPTPADSKDPKNEIKLGEVILNVINPVTNSTTTPSVIIDKRFAQIDSYNWLFRDGKASNNLFDNPIKKIDYSLLFKYNTTKLDGLSSGNILDALEMEGRPILLDNSTSTYKIFQIQAGGTNWPGEGAALITGSLNDLNDIAIVSKGQNSNSISKENKFSLLYKEGMIQKVYQGNIKEELVGEGVTKGSGDIVFGVYDTEIQYVFPVDNDEQTSIIGKGPKQETIIIRNIKLLENATKAIPNGNSLPEITGDTNLIANKIKVNNNISAEGSKNIQVNNITFGIGDKGGLTLRKEKGYNIQQDTEFDIEFYYSVSGGIDVLLSKFKLNVKPVEEGINIGEYVLKFDTRLKNQKNNWWYLMDGRITGSSSTAPKGNYSKMLEKPSFNHSFFNSDSTAKVLKVTVGDNEKQLGKPWTAASGWQNTNGREAYSNVGNAIVVTLPEGFSTREYSNELAFNFNPYDSSTPRNPYTFLAELDGNQYKVKMKAEVTNTDTYKRIDATASLNLQGLPKGISDKWESLASGMGNDGNMNLDFEDNKTIFQMGSFGGVQITDKFDYQVNSGNKVTVNKMNEDIKLNNNETPDINISFESNGEFKITKLTNEEINSTLVITPKYNDIVLGSLTLRITNTPEDLGTIIFRIDKRIVQNKNGDWITADGKLYKGNIKVGDYPDLIGIDGQIRINGVEDHKVIEVETINDITVDKLLNSSSGTKANYRYILNGNNEVAIPYSGTGKDVKLRNYDLTNGNLLIVSKKDSSSTNVTNIFTITSREENTKSIDTLRKGIIKEEYIGNETYNGQGKVNLVEGQVGTKYIFSTILSDSTIISGNGLNITNASGTPVNTKGLVGTKEGQNIANRLKVKYTLRDGSSNEVNSVLNGRVLETEYSNLVIGIETSGNNVGGLTLEKKGYTDISSVVITYYYDSDITSPTPTASAVTLGEFTLTVEDPILEIDGDGILNFGDMIYKSNSPYITQGGVFYIKQNYPEMLKTKNIEFSVDKDSVKPMMNTSGGTTAQDRIPLINTEVQKRSNTKFYLQSTADLSNNPNTGRYEGEIEVIVTITDKP